MSENPPSPETLVAQTVPFALPSEYGPALDRLIEEAADEILVFDRDLQDGGWGSPARIAALRGFLLSHRRTRIEIIVHDTQHIEAYLPRLVLLLQEFSHKLSILRTIEDGRNASDGFALADNRHFVHRFHLDSARGELTLNNPKKARELRERYDETLAFTEPGVNPTQLGL